MHSIRILALVASLLPAAILAQQAQPLGAQLRVRWKDFNIIVMKDGVKHAFGVDKEFAGGSIESVKLLSAKAAGDFIYLLFDVAGPSRGPEGAAKECGAGTERSLIWMKLDAAWNKVGSQSFAIESCWDAASLDSEGAPLTFTGPDLVARGTTFRAPPDKENTMGSHKWMHYEIKYSIKHPENGLGINLVPGESAPH